MQYFVVSKTFSYGSINAIETKYFTSDWSKHAWRYDGLGSKFDKQEIYNSAFFFFNSKEQYLERVVDSYMNNASSFKTDLI